MPLALQALLPLASVLLAAVVVRFRHGRRGNGLTAAAGAGAACVISLIELLRLAPSERVDSVYLSTFPYAELAIRLDALSLGFAATTAGTACLLMLIRRGTRGDRRDPWFGWLITTAAALAVMQADNLLLLYAMLQLLTLAWSGALDETTPRQHLLRLTQQVSDLGLLFAGGLAVQTVGTSAYAGVPSDTIGPLAFVAALLAAVARVGALALTRGGPQSPVVFEPAVAWAAPAGYLVLRLVSITGGRVPHRGLEVGLFIVFLTVAAVIAVLNALEGATPVMALRLVSVQAFVAMAISMLATPLSRLAAVWLWLLLIPLTGLGGLWLSARSTARAARLLSLTLAPPGAAFLALWMAGQALAQTSPLAALPLLLLAGITALTVTLALAIEARPQLDLAAAWGLGLLVPAAFPALLLAPLVAPAASAVRTIPAGTIATGPLWIRVGSSPWPAAIVTFGLVAVVLALLLRYRTHLPLRRSTREIRLRPVKRMLPKLGIHNLPSEAVARRMYWAGFMAVLVAVVIAR